MATYTNINEDIAPVPVNQSDLSAVSNATFYNPHEVLGGHLVPETTPEPSPSECSATGQERHHIHQKGTAEARHEFNGVFVAVIAAEKTADGWAVPDYRVCTTYEAASPSWRTTRTVTCLHRRHGCLPVPGKAATNRRVGA